MTERIAGPLRWTIGILFLAWLVDYTDRIVMTVALPSVGREFHLTHTQQGLILSIFGIGYAVAQLPGGVIADRFGARRIMVVAMTIWSVFTALTAFAANLTSLLAVRLFFGISEGVFPGAAFKAVSERTPSGLRMLVNSVVLCSVSFSIALSPMIASQAIFAFGWRDSFLIVSILGLLMAAAIAFLLPKPKFAQSRITPKFSLPDAISVLKRRDVWASAICFAGYDVVAYGLMSWTPSYLLEVRHMSIVATGFLASAPFFAATFSTIVGGWLFDRFVHKNPVLLISVIVPVVGAALLAMVYSSGVSGFIIGQSVAMGFLSLAYMPIFGMTLRDLPSGVTGLGSSIINFGGQVAGAVTPLCMGFIADKISYSAAFSLLLVGAIVMLGGARLKASRPAASVFAS